MGVYWVLGTHTQAWEGSEKAAVRFDQFRQMRGFVDAYVPDESRVCFAGDMNTSMENEAVEMLRALGPPGAPATAGHLVLRGFWIELDEDLDVSSDARRNHYLYCCEYDRLLGCLRLDWILAPGANDRLAKLTSIRYQ